MVDVMCGTEGEAVVFFGTASVDGDDSRSNDAGVLYWQKFQLLARRTLENPTYMLNVYRPTYELVFTQRFLVRTHPIPPAAPMTTIHSPGFTSHALTHCFPSEHQL